MDRLTSLTVFGSVVENGGFSAAARRMNMSVTMVSNHVQSLEDRLGVRLLNRSTRKVSLTEIGRSYYERSQQVLRFQPHCSHEPIILNPGTAVFGTAAGDGFNNSPRGVTSTFACR